VYRWELDGPAQQQFGDLSPVVRVTLAAFLDAVVIVDPVQYQRRPDEPLMPLAVFRQRPWRCAAGLLLWASVSLVVKFRTKPKCPVSPKAANVRLRLRVILRKSELHCELSCPAEGCEVQS
jgi:hypothetical protein